MSCIKTAECCAGANIDIYLSGLTPRETIRDIHKMNAVWYFETTVSRIHRLFWILWLRLSTGLFFPSLSFLDDNVRDFFPLGPFLLVHFFYFLLPADELRVLREGHQLLPVVRRRHQDVLLLRLQGGNSTEMYWLLFC